VKNAAQKTGRNCKYERREEKGSQGRDDKLGNAWEKSKERQGEREREAGR